MKTIAPNNLGRVESVSIFLEFLNNLYKDREMIMTMAIRELKVRYVGSLFGFFWAVISPLSQVAIYGIVFGLFFQAKANPVYGTDSFFLYLICGLIPWQFFSESVSISANTVISNRNLITKAAGFPSEVLSIITVISQIINHLIALVLLVVVILLFGIPITPMILLLLPYLLLAIIFTIGISWIVSALNVYMRDVQQIMSLILTAWFFFTPIFYSTAIIPPKLLPLLKLNPLYNFVEGYRYILLAGKMPPWENFMYFFIISVVTFGIGGLVFRRLKPGFAEIL